MKKLLATITLALAATIASAETKRWTWTDNSSNEDGFIFEARQIGGGQWVELGRVPANQNTFEMLDSELYDGARVWAYRESWGDEVRSAEPAENMRGDPPESPTDAKVESVTTVSESTTKTTTVTKYL